MSQTLLNALAWDINGSLLTSQGQIPNFNRNTPAYAEFLVNGSTRLVGEAIDRPRFSSLGSIYLEDESINLLASANDLSAAAWVKGSSITILDDRVLGMDGTYTGDRVSVSSTLGNADAQTIYQSLVLPQANQYTVTAWVRLAGGRFGPNDVFSVTGDVAAATSLSLATALNDNPGNYVPISLTFTSDGTLPPDYETDDVEQTVRVNFFVEAAVSFDVAVVQLEPGPIRTSPVPVDADLGGAQSRDGDSLVYPISPVQGLGSFCWYMNLEVWRGDGRLVQAGNFSAFLVNGRLRATCGAVTATSPDVIPAAAQLCIRVSQGLERVFVYVNGILVASQALTGYVANQAPLQVCGAGVRQFKCSYFFARDLSDGSISTGQRVRSDLLILHDQDSLVTDLPESHARISFSPIKILAGNRASVRMPAIRNVAQKMTTVTPGGGDTAKQVRIWVRTILNASAIQRDSVTINESTFEFQSDATPTAAEIAAGLTTMINTTPKLEPVTAAYTSGANFTITADVAGNGFYAACSENLTRTILQRNVTATLSVAVANGAEYAVGAAQVYRGYTWIANVRITAISGNTLTVQVARKATRDLIIQNDLLVQPRWQTRIGRNSYFVHHLEDHPDIRIAEKTDVDFALVNIGVTDRIVTPYVRITL